MSRSSPKPAACCATASPELKLYQAFIFSVPIFFTFILLLLFYLFYLRRRRVDWSSLRMRSSYEAREVVSRPSDTGLKKEFREMLPIIIFKESFSVTDTQCSVCLGDYNANDQLQQIPACGHTFHMDCIDLWLTTNTTCPLCRGSLLPAGKAVPDSLDVQEIQVTDTQIPEGFSEGTRTVILQRYVETQRREDRENHSSSDGEELWDARREGVQCVCDTEGSVVIDVTHHINTVDRL